MSSVIDLPAKKLSKDIIREVLYFVAVATKEGGNIVSALEYYMEEFGEGSEVRDTISLMRRRILNGREVEETLREFGFINEFQYSILKASGDKKEAYGQILAFEESASAASWYYFRDYVVMGFFFAMVVASMPLLRLMGEPFIEGARKLDKSIVYTYHPLIQHNWLAFSVAGGIVLLILAGVFVYHYTYRENLPLHYRLFKYKAINDAVVFATLIGQLLQGGVKSYEVFSILSQHIKPEGARDIMLSIATKIKNKRFFQEELQDLGFDKFTIFFIKNGFQTGHQQASWEAAKGSAERYKKEKESRVYHQKVRMSHVYFSLPMAYLVYVALMELTRVSLVAVSVGK